MKSDVKVLKPHVVLLEGQVWTTSIVVAQHFGKNHRDVLRAIQNTIEDLPEDFHQRNFALVEYRDAKGELRPMYRMTRDGFSLIAMSFTGKKALAWKVAYIKTFNAMEQALSRRASVAAPPTVSKAQVDSADFFLTLFYALNQEYAAATLMWYLLRQGAHVRPFKATLREISKALDYAVSHSGVAHSANQLKQLGVIEKLPGSLYKVLFDALAKHIASQSEDGETRPGLGDFVIPDADRLLH